MGGGWIRGVELDEGWMRGLYVPGRSCSDPRETSLSSKKLD